MTVTLPKPNFREKPITTPRQSIKRRAQRLGLMLKDVECPRTVLLSLNVGATPALIQKTRAREIPWVYAARPLHVGKVGRKSVAVIWAAPGAPLATVVTEDLIACGAEQFIGVGSLGAIQPFIGVGDQVVPTMAVREEGTSQHYLPPRVEAKADTKLVAVLSESCGELGVQCHAGPVWTTDAPYRETPSKIAHFRRKGILGVDMESSALFSIGIFHRMRVATILAASSNLVVPEARLGPSYIEGSLKSRNAVTTAVEVSVKAVGRVD